MERNRLPCDFPSCQLRAEQQTIGTGPVAAYPGGPWGFGQPQGPGGAWPILGLTAAQREQIQSFLQEQQLAPVRQLMELQLQLRVALFSDPPDLGAIASFGSQARSFVTASGRNGSCRKSLESTPLDAPETSGDRFERMASDSATGLPSGAGHLPTAVGLLRRRGGANPRRGHGAMG